MSSGTLTKEARVRLKPDTTEARVRLKPDTTEARVRLKPDTTSGGDQVRLKPDTTREQQVRDQVGLQPWQFFVLAALGLATAVTFMVRGQGVIPIVMLSVLMGTTAIAGFAALRLVRPLVAEDEDHTPMIGDRTRAALEREKMLALRAIKELDFDRAMGKLSDSDWKDMSGRLRARAARLIRQLDAGSHYREQIERDVAKRLTTGGDARLKPSRSDEDARLKESRPDNNSSAKTSIERVCVACTTANDADARFCKSCGNQLVG
jgi:hypothetical protein